MAEVRRKMPDFLKDISERIAKGSKQIARIRIPGGVIGKISTVLIFFVVSLSIVVYSVPQVSVALVAMGLSAGIVLIVCLRMISFADKNPRAALLEGAEFIINEHLRLGVKGNPFVVDDKTLRTDPEAEQAIESIPPNLLEQDQPEKEEEGGNG